MGFTRHRIESTPCQQSAGEFVIASVGGRPSAASRCSSYQHAFPSSACGSMRFEVSDVDRLLHRSSRNTICKCPTSVSASAQPQRHNTIPVNRHRRLRRAPRQQYPRHRKKAISLSRTRRYSSWRLPSWNFRERHVHPVQVDVTTLTSIGSTTGACKKPPRTPPVRSWRSQELHRSQQQEDSAAASETIRFPWTRHRRRRRVPRVR
jgi:hypothetical protein